jgi:hypothetical protein
MLVYAALISNNGDIIIDVPDIVSRRNVCDAFTFTASPIANKSTLRLLTS